MSKLIINHTNCRVEVDLLDTPFAEKWKEQFLLNKEYIKVMYQGNLFPFLHTTEEEDIIKEDFFIDTINTAIDNINKSIVGKQFPYRAFKGMSWDMTNKIHRCFTVCSLSEKLWEHSFTDSELLSLKREMYIDKFNVFDKYIFYNDFTIVDINLFNKSREIINHYIHLYEGLQSNNRCKEIVNLPYSSDHLIYKLDNTLDTGEKTFSQNTRISYDELKNSFPSNSEEYDVYPAWEITGKSYEICYSNYDNPLELDITNVDAIDGSFQIFEDTNFHKIYKETEYLKWLEFHKITDQTLFAPPPIGKVTYKDLNYSPHNFINTDETYMNGEPKPYPPFDTVELTFIE